MPVTYDAPVAESWVFVQPRYMTSRAISHYAVPIGGLGVAFFAATNVYRPIYREGVVYNYGMPRGPRGEDHQPANLRAEGLQGR